MKALCLAGAAALVAPHCLAQAFPVSAFASPLVVTASRGVQQASTLRDVVVVTREEIAESGSLSLGELLQRRAGIELRATGGPGQPQGLFIRGSGTAQTLVLVDGLRVGSATVGTTSIEHIPLELVERIEVVKGPMSSLYGADAIGGVVQVFTRGKGVPHLLGAVSFGTHRDRRASAGVTAADDVTALSLSAGAREVDAPSATNPRATFLFDPDRDPYENAFVNVKASRKLWQGEVVALEAFASRARTRFDAGLPLEGPPQDDRNDQFISGARVSSTNELVPGWMSRATVGHSRDRLRTRGLFPSEFETRQEQASWIHELATAGGGAILAGYEGLWQKVGPQEAFTTRRRDRHSLFASLRESWRGHRLEASVRGDDDEQFGGHTTGSLSYGITWAGLGTAAVTLGRGFRAPTFFDLYGPESDFYVPNPGLRPESSRSREVSLRSPPGAFTWRLAAYENRVTDLLVFTFPSVVNVGRAKIRGVEASVEATWWQARWRASGTAQDPVDDLTGLRLPSRARHFGTVEVDRAFGPVRAGLSVHASGDRYDRPGEVDRIPGYATVDARLSYSVSKRWSLELSAANLADKRRETSIGYDAPRRTVLLTLRLEAF